MKEKQYLICNYNAVTQLLLNIKNSLKIFNVIHAITSFSLPYVKKILLCDFIWSERKLLIKVFNF